MSQSNVVYTLDATIQNAKLKTKHYHTQHNGKEVDYTIITNDSSTLCFDDENNRIYRSVIFSSDDGNVLSFAPTSSISFDSFSKKYPDMNESNIVINEIVEGTMINLFYDHRIESWELSTRSSIGCNYWYFRNEYVVNDSSSSHKVAEQITFRNMFMDALRFDRNSNLNDCELLKSFNKNCCYSFVLQHPANHIVFHVSYPKLYLIALFEINGKTVKQIHNDEYEGVSQTYDYLNEMHNIGLIDYPLRIIGKTYDDLIQMCSNMSDNMNMGIMLLNYSTGDRASISNKKYEELKALRGNNPNLQYQYYCLKKINKLTDFLKHFPQYNKLFNRFNKQYHDFVTIVHQSYYSYYVKKEGIPIAKKYFIHASKIHHNVFIPALQGGNKVIITRSVVNEYFEGLQPNEMLYYLNYDKRQLAIANKVTHELDVVVENNVTTDTFVGDNVTITENEN